MEKEVKEQTLALEMLSELKKTTRRWFVVSIILLIALVGTNVAWLIYESSFDTVYEDSKIVLLTNITPDSILEEGHRSELATYKGVMISKTNAQKDMFKVNLLNALNQK